MYKIMEWGGLSSLIVHRYGIISSSIRNSYVVHKTFVKRKTSAQTLFLTSPNNQLTRERSSLSYFNKYIFKKILWNICYKNIYKYLCVRYLYILQARSIHVQHVCWNLNFQQLKLRQTCNNFLVLFSYLTEKKNIQQVAV